MLHYWLFGILYEACDILPMLQKLSSFDMLYRSDQDVRIQGDAKQGTEMLKIGKYGDWNLDNRTGGCQVS